MMLPRRRVLLSPLVMVLVSLGRRRSGGRGVLILAMPWARDLTGPQQLGDQEERGDEAGCATKEHDGV